MPASEEGPGDDVGGSHRRISGPYNLRDSAGGGYSLSTDKITPPQQVKTNLLLEYEHEHRTDDEYPGDIHVELSQSR
ncbi:hypothetical protein GCM10009835_02740 [Planosporangium flavigriseum]